jgi:hypothetical protein
VEWQAPGGRVSWEGGFLGFAEHSISAGVPALPPKATSQKSCFVNSCFTLLEIELWKRPAEGLGAHWSRTLIVVIV